MSDSELESDGFESERKERKSRKSKVSKRSKCRRKVSSASIGQGSMDGLQIGRVNCDCCQLCYSVEPCRRNIEISLYNDLCIFLINRFDVYWFDLRRF